MIKIGITGWAGSGKTEAAKYLKAEFDCQIISFADGIKYIDKYLFNTGKKDRERLQKIGEFFRSIDPDIWTKRTLESGAYEENVVIDDLRRLNEYDALSLEGYKFIRVVADEDIRIKRLIERDGQCDTSLLYNESESGCAVIEMIEIDNNGRFIELYRQLDSLMNKWGYKKAREDF